MRRLKTGEHKPATSRQVPQDSETSLRSWPLGAIAHAAMFAGSDMASHDVHLLRWAGAVNTFSMGLCECLGAERMEQKHAFEPNAKSSYPAGWRII